MVVGIFGLLSVVFTFTIINTHFQNKNLKEQYLREAKNLINLVEFRAAEELAALQLNRLRENIHFIKQTKLVEEILIFNNDKMVVTDGRMENSMKFTILDDPLIDEAFQKDDLVYQIMQEKIVLYLPIDLSNRHLGGIKLSYSLSHLRQTEISILFNNLKYAGLVFIVGLVLMLIFIGKIVKPIKELTRATERVSEGSYDEKIIIKTRDELELLANSFNAMVKNLKNSRDELVAAKEEAEKSDRLKSEFLAQMSHEIRTPLNAIVNFTELLKNEFHHKLHGDIEEAFDIIDFSSERLIRTIELILGMSELQSGNFQPNKEKFDLYDEIIVPVVNEFKFAAKQKSLKLTSENQTGNTVVYGDKYSITQMLTNLVDNAIKYTESGRVKIIAAETNENRLEVLVQDTGIGISEDFLPFLFQPFMQEERGYSRKFEGTGLGLSLVKKYCEINHAEIKVETKKSVGTTFHIIFPKSD